MASSTPKIKIEISAVEARKGAQAVNKHLSSIIETAEEINKALEKVQTSLKSMGASKGSIKAANDQDNLSRSLKKSEALLRKQNRSLASASEQYKNLSLRIKLVGGGTQLIERLTRSFNSLEEELKSGVLEAKKYDEVMIRFRKTQGSVNRELRSLNAGAKKSSKSVGGLEKNMRNLGSSAIFAVGPLSGIGARLVAFTAIASRTSVKLALIAAGFAGLSVVLFKLVSASIKASLEMQRIIGTLTVATGSLIGAKDAFKFVTDVSLELGLSLKEAADQFGQLSAAARGTALEGEGIRKIFLATSKAAVALGLKTEQVTGIFRALQQMLSKGTVQAEELRGQLGERLPGAFQIAAIAMGVTTAELGKMLKEGKIMAEELFPKMGDVFEERFGQQAIIASENLQAALNRLSTTQFLYSVALDETIKSGSLAAKTLDSLSSIISKLGDNIANILSGIGGLGVSFAILAAPKTLKGLKLLVDVFKRLALTLFGLGAIASPLGLIAALGRIAIAVTGGFIAFSFFSDGLEKAAISQKELIRQLRLYIDVVKEAEGATRGAINAQIDLAEKGIKAIRIEMKSMQLLLGSAKDLSLEPIKGFKGLRGMHTRRIREIRDDESRGVEANLRIRELRGELEILLEQLNELRELPVIEFGEKLSTATKNATTKIKDLVRELEKLREVNMQLSRGGALGVFGAQRVEAESKAKDLIRGVPEKELRELFKPLGLVLPGNEDLLISTLADILLATESINKENKDLLKSLIDAPALYKKQLVEIEKVELSLKQSNVILRLRLEGLKTEADALQFRNTLESRYSELSGEEFEKSIRQKEINDQLIESWKRQQESIKAAKKMAQDFATTIAQGFENAMLSANSFKEVLGEVIRTLARITFNATVTQPLTNFITGLFRGLSHGGSVKDDETVVVGENGPELFTPNTDGVIIPNSALTGGSGDRRLDELASEADFNRRIARGMTPESRIVDTSKAFKLGELDDNTKLFKNISLIASGFPLQQVIPSALFHAAKLAAKGTGRFAFNPNTSGSVPMGSAEALFESRTDSLAGRMNLTDALFKRDRTFSSSGGRQTFGGGGVTDNMMAGRQFESQAFSGGGDRDFGGGEFGGGGFSGGGFSGTPFAAGGPISSGTRATVGELGPEIFVPSGGRGKGKGTVVVNQQFDFSGASLEVQALLVNSMREIEQNILNAIQIDADNAGSMSRLGR